MSVRQGRILRGAEAKTAPRIVFPEPPPTARLVPAAIFEAREEAARIVREAQAAAERCRDDIREEELAKLVASHIALGRGHIPAAKGSEDGADTWVTLAKLLAERLLGQELALDASKIRALAAPVLDKARGSREGTLWAHPADAPSLRALLSELGLVAIVVRESEELVRGSLHLQTDVGEVDGRIETQLDRLGLALRDALLRES
ncbi:MAG: FliH/SctL family protein [Polyangiaceae bacterium]